MVGLDDDAVTLPCPSCGSEVPIDTSFCTSCGADQSLAAVDSRQPRTALPWFGLIGTALVAAGAAVLWFRFDAVGPGPDLLTTLRWMALGDGGRGRAIATLSRGYESSRAVLRLCISEGTPADLNDVDWQKVAGYNNANWRGFVSLVQWAASRASIDGRLAWLLDVDGTDGWGRRWRASLAPWDSPQPPQEFFPGLLGAGEAPPRTRPLLHLVLLSSGPDGRPYDADDITFEAVFPAPSPLRIALPGEIDQREYDLERGLVWVRWDGTPYDLIDSRVLAEFYLSRRAGD